MAKRGRKPINEADLNETELSKNQQIVRESNGLLILFGNRVVSKYKEDYLNTLKQKYGIENFLKHLETHTADESFKYTKEYIEKNEKRNLAVVKFREKERLKELEKAEKYKQIESENKRLEIEINNLEKHFIALLGYLNQLNIPHQEFSNEIVQIIQEYDSL